MAVLMRQSSRAERTTLEKLHSRLDRRFFHWSDVLGGNSSGYHRKETESKPVNGPQKALLRKRSGHVAGFRGPHAARWFGG
jgi:hypothetical protein